jgi:hypothetical protein
MVSQKTVLSILWFNRMHIVLDTESYLVQKPTSDLPVVRKGQLQVDTS